MLRNKLIKPKRFGLNNNSVNQSLNESSSLNSSIMHVKKLSRDSDDSMVIKRLDTEDDGVQVKRIGGGADDSMLDPNTSMCSLASDLSGGGVVVVKKETGGESADDSMTDIDVVQVVTPGDIVKTSGAPVNDSMADTSMAGLSD